MARSRRSAPARRAPPPSRSSAPSRAPATTQSRSAPPAVPQQGGSSGLLSGMMGTVAQGFAFGTGSAIAHRTVGAVANSIGGGSGSEQPAPEHGAYEQQANAPPQNPCEFDQTSFYQCLQSNNGDLQACSALHDALQACQLNVKQQQFM